MKRVLMASVIAGTFAIATIATPTSAHAQWRRGWGWGLGGLAMGLTIAAALSRPAYAYGYGYPAYSYGYGYGSLWLRLPAYASYGYGYPAYSYGYGGGYSGQSTATPAMAATGYAPVAATGQPIAPPTIAVIDQSTVPPSTEAIGSPDGLRSTALVGAEPLSAPSPLPWSPRGSIVAFVRDHRLHERFAHSVSL